MVTSLLDMPNEVLILIFERLPTPMSRTCFLRLCRRLYDILTPVFYREINLYGRGSRLVRTLVTHRNLAANIRITRELQEYGNHFASGNSRTEPDFSNDDVAYLEQLPQQLSVPTQVIEANEDLIQLPEGENSYTIWMSLVLLMAPQVTDVSFSVDYQDTQDLDRICILNVLRRTVRQSLNEQPFFHNLRTIHVGWYDTEGGLEARFAASLFSLPSLRQFSGHMIVEDRYQDEESDDEALEVTPNTSLVEEIDLTLSNGHNGMNTLIELCAGHLRSFIYLHADGTVDGDFFDPISFSHSLAPTQQTLESLWLDFDPGQQASDPIEDGYFGSLADYEEMKHLHMRLQNLLGVLADGSLGASLVDYLPPKLEHLSLSDVDATTLVVLVKQFTSMIEKMSPGSQSLRKIVIEGNFSLPVPLNSALSGQEQIQRREVTPATHDSIEPLVEICRKYGIDLYLRDPSVHGLLTDKEIGFGKHARYMDHLPVEEPPRTVHQSGDLRHIKYV